MTNKEILHEILKGMCPYMSYGVPIIYWELALKLTLEVYGKDGVNLLNSVHGTFDESVSRHELIVHNIGGSSAAVKITPLQLIEQLETLKT